MARAVRCALARGARGLVSGPATRRAPVRGARVGVRWRAGVRGWLKVAGRAGLGAAVMGGLTRLFLTVRCFLALIAPISHRAVERHRTNGAGVLLLRSERLVGPGAAGQPSLSQRRWVEVRRLAVRWRGAGVI